jgi:hypothetical protein
MRVLAIGLCAGLATLASAQPAPDFARAKQLYDTASSELDKGAYADAMRDFGAAYEITKDPVVFFKIALANEKAGKCDVALVYYARYLREAKPAQHFVDTTKEHVAACGGASDDTLAGMDGSGSGSTPTKSSEPEVGQGALAATGSDTGSGSDAGAGSDAGSGADLTGLGSGSATPAVTHRHGRDLPWLMIGGALAFVTAGAVLAYSASSSEQDIRDLYVGLDNMSPVYDMKTQQRYQELLDEGHRYQYLSLGAFGIAAGFTVAATLLFVHDHNVEQQRLLLTPTASANSAGVSATLRF